jgi:predicted short-subunit dehydrogenase-like oxidoreductase (DUF2520 family)
MPPQKRPAKTPRAEPTRAARSRAREAAPPGATKKIETGSDAARPTTGRRTTVAIVGAGRLGSALALALDSCGYRVSALVSRRRARARRAARLLAHSRPLALSSGELDRLPAADLLIIATPDDQIEATAARAGASFGAPRNDPRRTRRVALHASGALSSESLAPLRALGFAVGSLHPLASVSDPKTAPENLRGAFYCVEGDAAAVRLARRIARSLGGRSFSVRARDKALYHASAVLAAGHIVALFDLATESLAACGLARPRARAVLLPLARSAVANLAAAPENAAALTGPFARADCETVRRNLSAFDRKGLRGAKAVYELLGLASLELAGRAGADPASLAEIARALSGAGAGEGD